MGGQVRLKEPGRSPAADLSKVVRARRPVSSRFPLTIMRPAVIDRLDLETPAGCRLVSLVTTGGRADQVQ
jgi:hypothetical protein